MGPHQHLSCVMPGSLGGRDGTPHWAGRWGKQDPLQQHVPLALCLGSGAAAGADMVCGAGVPSSGRRAPSAPRPELPKVRLPAVRARKFLPGAIRGPACCCPTFPGLGTVSPRLLLMASQRPQSGCVPRPDCHGDRLYTVSPSPPPCPKSGPQADQRPPRREPARARGASGPPNSKPRGAGPWEVKFFGGTVGR